MEKLKIGKGIQSVKAVAKVPVADASAHPPDPRVAAAAESGAPKITQAPNS